MSAFWRIFKFAPLLLGIVAFHTDLSCGDETDLESRKVTRDDCRRWIEKLANPSKPPFQTRSAEDLPAGTDQSSLFRQQKPIVEAYNELSRNIDVALPLLAESFSDDRFSYVFEVNGPYHIQTVGEACQRIVSTHVNVYRRTIRKADATGHWITLLSYEPDPIYGKDLSWARRALKDLQLERIDWACRQQKPKKFSDEEWQAALQNLTRMGDEIRSTGKAIQVDHRLQLFSK